MGMLVHYSAETQITLMNHLSTKQNKTKQNKTKQKTKHTLWELDIPGLGGKYCSILNPI